MITASMGSEEATIRFSIGLDSASILFERSRGSTLFEDHFELWKPKRIELNAKFEPFICKL